MAEINRPRPHKIVCSHRQASSLAATIRYQTHSSAATLHSHPHDFSKCSNRTYTTFASPRSAVTIINGDLHGRLTMAPRGGVAMTSFGGAQVNVVRHGGMGVTPSNSLTRTTNPERQRRTQAPRPSSFATNNRKRNKSPVSLSLGTSRSDDDPGCSIPPGPLEVSPRPRGDSEYTHTPPLTEPPLARERGSANIEISTAVAGIESVVDTACDEGDSGEDEDEDDWEDVDEDEERGDSCDSDSQWETEYGSDSGEDEDEDEAEPDEDYEDEDEDEDVGSSEWETESDVSGQSEYGVN